MGLLKGIFKSSSALLLCKSRLRCPHLSLRYIYNPQNRTAGSAYTFFLGRSMSGKRVNERSAMQMTAVYACVRILSEAIAGLPLHLYIYNDKGGKEKVIDNPLYFLLHNEPNTEMTSFAFMLVNLKIWI